jgi:biotin transport system substrate-specific component
MHPLVIRSGTRNIVLASLTIALTAAGAWLRIPVGPVPISLQTLFVLLSGVVLGPLLGAAAMGIYLVLGLVGLPVFAAGGGPGYILSPTFGFLLSFPFASFVAGFLCPPAKSVNGIKGFRMAGAFFAGTAVVYLIGIPWFAFNLLLVQGKTVGIGTLLMLGLVPFLPGDLLKITAATFLTPPLQGILKRRAS